MAQCRGGIGSSPVPFPPGAVTLLAEQGACMMPYCLVRRLNSGIPSKGVSASVSALPALGPTPVVALTMPLAFWAPGALYCHEVLGIRLERGATSTP